MLPSQFADHESRAGIVRGVDTLKGSGVVTLTAPGDMGNVRVVVEAEVLERAKKASFEGVPEAELRSESAVEAGKDVALIRPLWRRRQPK